MRLSTMLDYSRGIKKSLDSVVELERAGLDIVWVAEAYGYDGVSQMGYLAARTERMEIGSAILPIYSRTPTLLAQTAAGLDAVSGGRFILGLGASGPQVIEGWHGVPYTSPLERTREIIEICRKVWRREVLTNDGLYQIPLPPGHGAGQAPQAHHAPGARLHPDLGGVHGPEKCGDDGRGGRRVVPVPVHARTR